MRKIIMTVCYLTLIIACRELPEPDNITIDLQGDVFLDASSPGLICEVGQEVTIRWDMTPGIKDEVKIELLNGNEDWILIERTVNDGEFSWTIGGLTMQDGYRIKLTLLGGVFDGVWHSGVWLDGVWNGGIWINGIWHSGIWNDGLKM